jgi:WD40 repeat protein
MLIWLGVDRALRRWNLETFQPVGNPIFLDANASALAIAGDVIWTNGPSLQSWDLRTGAVRGDASKEIEGISSLAVDGNVLVSGHWNGMVKARDASNGQHVRSSTRRAQSRVNCVALYKNFAISGSPAGNLYVWNLTTLDPIFEVQMGSPVNDLISTPGGVCAACADGVVCLELNL